MSRMLIVKSCKECPMRTEEESHGPCDSDYWDECSLTDKVLTNEKSKFPSFCTLKEVKEENKNKGDKQ